MRSPLKFHFIELLLSKLSVVASFTTTQCVEKLLMATRYTMTATTRTATNNDHDGYNHDGHKVQHDGHSNENVNKKAIGP